MLKTNVLLTIDVEFSIGGHFQFPTNKPVPADRIIYCKINGKEYGINLIMDILDDYGMKGIFFVETESRFYFGESVVADIANHIQSRGHEVQLHTHPNFRTFIDGKVKLDDMRKYSLSEQTQIINDGRTFLQTHGINNISAHRSGGFHSNQDTIEAQVNSGLKFSSNYNIAYPNCSYIERYPCRNDIFQVDKIIEVPVTCYKEFKMHKEWNCFQLSAASFSEIKEALNFYHDNGTQVITFLTHSFEFVEKGNVQYANSRPLKYLIKRFSNICNYLEKNQDKFEVVTFADLEKNMDSEQFEFCQSTSAYCKSSFVDTSFRYLENIFQFARP